VSPWALELAGETSGIDVSIVIIIALVLALALALVFMCLRRRLVTFVSGGTKLYHQTDVATSKIILQTQQMKPGNGGVAGGGIYFATTPELTAHKAQKNGVILEATVALGVRRVRPEEGVEHPLACTSLSPSCACAVRRRLRLLRQHRHWRHVLQVLRGQRDRNQCETTAYLALLQYEKCCPLAATLKVVQRGWTWSVAS